MFLMCTLLIPVSKQGNLPVYIYTVLSNSQINRGLVTNHFLLIYANKLST